jgi:hypothetical protein
MPHNDRSLVFRGKPLGLNMLYDVFKLSQGSDKEAGSIRVSKMSKEVFEKNALNRMKVYVAFRAVSESMVGLIDSYVQGAEEQARYAPLRALCVEINGLVDVINMKPGKEMVPLDSPDHKQLQQLVRVVEMLTEWRDESKAASDMHRFLPMTTYEDVCLVCISTIGLSKVLLKTDRSIKIAQNRLGSDVCEHRFSTCKSFGAYLKGDYDVKNARADANSMSAQSFTANDRGNSGKRAVQTADMTAPIARQQKKKKTSK